MWVAFDKAKVGFVPSGTILDRARTLGVQPVKVGGLDVDDATGEIREQWRDCLLGLSTEAAVHEVLAEWYGEGWGRFHVVEVPDDETFGCVWVFDRPGESPRAAGGVA